MKFGYRSKMALAASLVVFGAADAVAASVEARVSPSPRLTIHDGDAWSVNTRGRLELDSLTLDGSPADEHQSIYDRRTRIGLDASYGEFWSGTVEVDFADEWDAEWTDVMLAYHNQQDTRIQIGHFKEYFGMERIASSSATMFNERAAIDTFTPQRGVGVQVMRYSDLASVSLGIFTDSMVTNSKKDDWAATSRVTYGGDVAENAVAHVGASATYRQMEQVSFSSGPDTTAASFNAVSTGTIADASEMMQGGLELAYAHKALHVEAEYMYSRVERAQNPTVAFDGWYLETGWMLTGEQRPYSPAKEAIFGSIEPASPFDLSKNQWGAWEVAARYQELDLNDDAVNGGEMAAITGGVNWYLNKSWRMTANASHIALEDRAGMPDDDMMMYSMRLRVSF